MFNTPWLNGSTDTTIKNAMDTPAGKGYVLGPDHFLVKGNAETLLDGQWETAAHTRMRVPIENAQWAQLHVMDVSLLGNLPARWVVRPGVLSAHAEDLRTQGGLDLSSAQIEDTGQLLRAVKEAAAKMPKFTLGAVDVIIIDHPNTGTAVDDMLTSALTGADKTGAVYAQYRQMTGGWLSPAEALNNQLGLFQQMPYTIGSVVGDIQGLPTAAQAQVIGAYFVRRKIADRFDEVIEPTQTMAALYRHAGDGYYEWIFGKRWTTVYPDLASIGHAGSGGALEASAEEAMEAVRQAALALSVTGAQFTSGMVDSVNMVADSQGLSITEDTRYDNMRMAPRLMAVVELYKRELRLAERAGGARAGDGGAERNAVESTDAKWSEAARDADFIKMLTSLTALNTVPLDAKGAASVMLQADSPAGVIFLLTKGGASVRVLRDMTTARSDIAVQGAVNQSIMVARDGAKRADWGTPITAATAKRIVAGKWVSYSTCTEASVVCDKAGSLDFWNDVCKHVVRKEDGLSAAEHWKVATGDCLAVFADANPGCTQCHWRWRRVLQFGLWTGRWALQRRGRRRRWPALGAAAPAIYLALGAAAAAKGWRLMERGAGAPTKSSSEAPLYKVFGN